MEPPSPDYHPNCGDKIDRRLLALVALCGFLSLAIYLLLPRFLLPITSSIPSRASDLFPWVKSISEKSLHNFHETSQFDAGLPCFACCGALFALYAFVLWLVRGNQSTRLQWVVFGCGAAFLVSFLFAPVMLSSDLFAYAFYGRLLSVHGADVYADDPAGTGSDPFLLLFGHNTPSIYGPLWNLISAGLTFMGGTNIGLVVLLFRGAAATAVLAGAGLIWSSLRRYSPESATQGVVLFLWSPLVILETGLSGHNDATMAALVLLAIWLHIRGYRSGAVVALALSAMVKFVTGPLVPLYLLMLLRESKSWRDRGGLLLRSTLGIVVAAALTITLAHARSGAPTTQYASAPDFYANNFHELIFKGLRRMLGEDPESAEASIYFNPWWIKPTVEIKLWAAPEDSRAPVLSSVKAGQPLLVITPQVSDWQHVYDPVSHKKGFIDASEADTMIRNIDEPEGADADPTVELLESSALDWPTVLKANSWIRAVTGILFAVFGLVAAWRTTNFHRFLAWAPAVILAMYYTIMTQIWPWYLIWALALVALRPGKLAAKLAIALSAGILSLYVTIGFAGSDPDWVYPCRSIFAVVLPTLGVGVAVVAGRLFRRKAAVAAGAPGLVVSPSCCEGRGGPPRSKALRALQTKR